MDNIHLREAAVAEDAVIARHFFRRWQDSAVPKTAIQENSFPSLNRLNLLRSKVQKSFPLQPWHSQPKQKSCRPALM
jgi:hypothetical protein